VTGDKGAFYRPELDALRFLAFLFVFLRHTTPMTSDWYARKLHLPAIAAEFCANVSALGSFGVYLFFLLSAYLITVLLLREKERYGKLHVPQFYGRRALRIWPLYFFIIAAGVARQALLARPIEWKGTMLLLLFAGNWGMIFHSLAVSPLWSVSVEEQFYLAWPPVVARMSVAAIEWAGIGLLAGPLVTAALARGLGASGWDFWFMGSFSCLAAMGAGIILACRTRGESIENMPPRAALGAAAFGCWYAATLLRVGDGSPAASLTGLALINLGSFLMLAAAMDARPHRWLVELGKISFGLYIYHSWAIMLVERFVGRKMIPAAAYPLAMALELALTIAAAWASYRWLERPFLRMKERLAFVASRPV
jgi:peptidoglycan/LPS O-acetylase OafA/YrhL